MTDQAARRLARGRKRKNGGPLFIALVLAMAFNRDSVGADSGTAGGASAKSPTEALRPGASSMKIRLTVDGKTITASLNDNATSRDFVSLLPATLTLQDYASTEKINYLSRKLSVSGAPAGYSPSAGDIAYYAPWGNLAIFYKGAGYANGLIKLGRIDSGADALNVPDSVKAKFELLLP